MNILLLLLICLASIFMSGFIIARTNEVFRFRRILINKIFRNSDWSNLVQEYESVSYHKMVYCFWRDPKEFYKGTKLYELL